MSTTSSEYSGVSPAGTETVTVTVLNTRFGDALKYQATLSRILPISSAGHLALVGFSEVTPGVRGEAVAAIEGRGYKAIVPEGKGAKIDTVWAVSPGLEVEPETTTAHPFPGRIASRPGRRQKRHAGMHTIVTTTPGGHKVRATTERLAPPMRGKGARYMHLGHIASLLDEITPPDPAIDIDVNGGDQNHANGPEAADKALWSSKGFSPVLAEGTPTYNIEAAGRSAKVAVSIMHLLGHLPTMHFDEIYLRAGPGHELITGNAVTGDLLPNQIGYTAEIVPVSGTDHHAIETTLTFAPILG